MAVSHNPRLSKILEYELFQSSPSTYIIMSQMLFLCFSYIAQSSKIFCSIFCKYLYVKMRKFITNGPCPRLHRQACTVLVSNPLLSYVDPTTVSTLSECLRWKCRTSTNFCVHPKFLLQLNPVYDHKHPYKGFSLEHPIVYQIMLSGFTQPVSAPLTKRGRTESETSGMICPYLCYPFGMVKPKQLRSDS